MQAALGQSAHEERQALLAEPQQAQAGLRDQLELEQTHHAEEKKRLEEELQAVKDTAAFSDADLLQVAHLPRIATWCISLVASACT